MIKVQTLPKPGDWEWEFENNKLISHWTDLSEAAVAVEELIQYACQPKKGLKRTMQACAISAAYRTELYVCKGQCERK